LNIEEGQLLYLIPPELDGDRNINKKRYLLILNVDDDTNTVEMINVSSLKGKEHKLLYNSNILINNHLPLPVPSFAKLDVLYTTNKFEGLSNYIAFNGNKLDKSELENIKFERYKYIKNANRIKVINYSEKRIKELNP